MDSSKQIQKWAKQPMGKPIVIKNWAILVLVGAIILIVGVSYGMGSESGQLYAKKEMSQDQEVKSMIEKIQSKTLDQVWEWWLKSLMALSIVSAPVIGIVILVSWLIHGVGFRIL